MESCQKSTFFLEKRLTKRNRWFSSVVLWAFVKIAAKNVIWKQIKSCWPTVQILYYWLRVFWSTGYYGFVCVRPIFMSVFMCILCNLPLISFPLCVHTKNLIIYCVCPLQKSHYPHKHTIEWRLKGAKISNWGQNNKVLHLPFHFRVFLSIFDHF